MTNPHIPYILKLEEHMQQPKKDENPKTLKCDCGAIDFISRPVLRYDYPGEYDELCKHDRTCAVVLGKSWHDLVREKFQVSEASPTVH